MLDYMRSYMKEMREGEGESGNMYTRRRAVQLGHKCKEKWIKPEVPGHYRVVLGCYCHYLHLRDFRIDEEELVG